MVFKLWTCRKSVFSAMLLSTPRSKYHQQINKEQVPESRRAPIQEPLTEKKWSLAMSKNGHMMQS